MNIPGGVRVGSEVRSWGWQGGALTGYDDCFDNGQGRHCVSGRLEAPGCPGPGQAWSHVQVAAVQPGLYHVPTALGRPYTQLGILPDCRPQIINKFYFSHSVDYWNISNIPICLLTKYCP